MRREPGHDTGDLLPSNRTLSRQNQRPWRPEVKPNLPGSTKTWTLHKPPTGSERVCWLLTSSERQKGQFRTLSRQEIWEKSLCGERENIYICCKGKVRGPILAMMVFKESKDHIVDTHDRNQPIRVDSDRLIRALCSVPVIDVQHAVWSFGCVDLITPIDHLHLAYLLYWLIYSCFINCEIKCKFYIYPPAISAFNCKFRKCGCLYVCVGRSGTMKVISCVCERKGTQQIECSQHFWESVTNPPPPKEAAPWVDRAPTPQLERQSPTQKVQAVFVGWGTRNKTGSIGTLFPSSHHIKGRILYNKATKFAAPSTQIHLKDRKCQENHRKSTQQHPLRFCYDL